MPKYKMNEKMYFYNLLKLSLLYVFDEWGLSNIG